VVSFIFLLYNLRLLSKKTKYIFVCYVSGRPVVRTLQARQFVYDCRQVHRSLVFVTESKPSQRQVQCSFHWVRESDSRKGKEKLVKESENSIPSSTQIESAEE